MAPRRMAAACLAAAGIAVLAASPASAGEVNGNGTELPLRGASICKYSGLNDEITPDEPTRTQSYGTFLHLYQGWSGLSMKDFKELSGFPSPGDACNPTKGFEE